jgi:methyltransferase
VSETIAHMLRSPVIWIVGLVALQRLSELVISNRNTKRLIAKGGREVGAGHYPVMVLVHVSWLVAIAALTPLDTQPNWWLIGVFVLLQLARVWVLATLGPYWTTRVITLDTAPLITGGPFRFVHHPNYWVVAAEIAVLPLAFGQWGIAIIWSVMNALLLRHRISIESAALAPRRAR